MIVAEIIPITSSILTESLSYFSATEIMPGTLVTIPLRKKEILGIVIRTSLAQDLKQSLRTQNFKIRHISKIHEQSVFSPAYLETVTQLKNYYLINTGKIINITYPAYILKNLEQFSIKRIPTAKESFQQTTVQLDFEKRIQYYKDIIEKNIVTDTTSHIICPTLEQIKKIERELSSFSEQKIYTFHGKTSAKKISGNYSEIQNQACIIISTTGFIDVPAHNKTTIILEQDSSNYYYRASAPFIDMRIFVEQYAKNSGYHLIIGDSLLRPWRHKNANSSTPDSEIFDLKKIEIVNANQKRTGKQSDTERILELSKKERFSSLSPKILKKIEKSILNNDKIFCYVSRKSLAPTIVCRDCGKLATSSTTGNPYSLYIKTNKQTQQKERIFVDGLSNEQVPAFDICQFCQSWKLQGFGISVDRVIADLSQHFPNLKILALDSFHSKTQKELKIVVAEFYEKNNSAVVLVGTQKALPYLENIDSSYIISLDTLFAQMSYTSDFRALALIQSIYESTRKKLTIQTRNILEKNLPILTDGDYRKYVQESNNQAREYLVHPYGTLIKINHICARQDYVKAYSLYNTRLKNYAPDIRVQNYFKKDFIQIVVLLHLDKKLWNIEHQELILSNLLPFEQRNINIEINPEVF